MHHGTFERSRICQSLIDSFPTFGHTLWINSNADVARRQITRLLYDAVGGSAIYSAKSPLDRHLRDMQTACQHIAGQAKGLEAVGALLLGGDSRHPLL